ncbi:hypothetical protein ACNPQM_32425 [Streptomyces sp. NPDC056231]|uniref:hypothetical protein n=1 Tax=Streptomyces sp. NPDC056231 TaxID=3345755 RepID=UPI003AAE9FDD
MRFRTARLAATAGAVALLGALAAATPAVAAPTSATPASATAQAAAWQFVAWYPNKTQCQTGGAYYLRHGYSEYICQLDPLRGWALNVRWHAAPVPPRRRASPAGRSTRVRHGGAVPHPHGRRALPGQAMRPPADRQGVHQ